MEGFFEVVTADPAVYGFIFRSIRSSDGGLLDNTLMRSLEARFEVVAGVLAPGADPVALRFLAHATFGFIISAIESWEATRAPSRELALDLIVTVLANGLLAAQAAAPRPPADARTAPPDRLVGGHRRGGAGSAGRPVGVRSGDG